MKSITRILALACLASLVTVPLAAALPPSGLFYMNATENERDSTNIEALKAPHHAAAVQAELAKLNANGGIPFYNMDSGRYDRIRFPANATNFADLCPADNAKYMGNRGTMLLRLGPGKNVLVFLHATSPVSSVSTIWECGPRFPVLKLALHGDLSLAKRKADDRVLLVFTSLATTAEVIYVFR